MALGTNAELDAILKDSGEAVSYGSAPVQSTYGHLDHEEYVDGEAGELAIHSDKASLVIRDGSLSDLQQNRRIIVAGANYRIRDVGRVTTEGVRRIHILPVRRFSGPASLAPAGAALAAAGDDGKFFGYVPGDSGGTLTRATIATYVSGP